ncbi:hypothetical protein KR200_003830, partial [Drosophila serrata]
DALRSEYRPRRPCGQLKYPRPKTKPEYQDIYPWLLPDETDPHFVFCAVCECRLACKRSDLGKHEGSIKHSENAQRKAMQSKGQPEEVDVPLVMKWEYNEDEEVVLAYGPGPPLHNINITNNNHGDDDDDDEEEEGGGDADTDPDYEPDADEERDAELEEREPASKQQRRTSLADSQHSGMDYLPLHVTINELPTTAPSASSTFPSSSTPAAPPCRITIKKVSALNASPSIAVKGPEINSKATITPIAAGGPCYTPSPRTTPSYAARQLQSFQLQQTPARDSLELFFDSICATVKTLPPKLATEGKIRVMQLVGELELRALGEQEASSLPPVQQDLDLPENAEPGAAEETPGSGQQNATVASTT